MNEAEYYKILLDRFSYNGKLISISNLLPIAAIKWPNRIAVICENNNITYKQLLSSSEFLKEKITKSGIVPKDRVVIFYENSIEFFIAYFSIVNSEAIVVPLNTFLTQAEFEKIINDCQPSAIFISENLKSKIDQNILNKIKTVFSNIDILLINTDIQNNPKIKNSNPDDLATILYTSGTTGSPKGVMLSSKNIISNSIQGIARFKQTEEYKIYCPLPLFHSLPQNICIWSNFLIGGTAIISSKIDRKSLLQGFEHKPDIFIAVPAIYGLLCSIKNINLNKIEYFISGGDALPNKIKMFFELIYKRKICNGYGLTECSPFIAVDFDDYIQPSTVVGKLLAGIEYQIRDDQNNILPNGEIGILWVKGDNIMLGYYNHLEATNNILIDGWLCTGDLAKINCDNKLEICGREKDLIINKGVKIYPQEIEAILMSHEDILQVAVIGYVHQNEEIPVAFIKTKENISEEKIFLENIKLFCYKNLAPYKVPKIFKLRHEMPLTSTGKIDKKKIKSEYDREADKNPLP